MRRPGGEHLIAAWLMISVCLMALSAPVQAAEPQRAAETPQRARSFDAHAFGQVFAGYDAVTTETQAFNEFTLRRAEAGVRFEQRAHRVGFLLNMEAVRSAGPQSFFGVAGDSIVFRVKHAFAYAAPELGPGRLELRAGMIPDLWINAVEPSHDLRGVSPLVSERGRFYDTSDLGASARWSGWDGLLVAGFALTNGEGRARAEQNTGKNGTTTLSVRALQPKIRDELGALSVHLSYRDGSLGVSSGKNHRIAGAVTFAHPRGFIGAEVVQANGYQGTPQLTARGMSLWANGQLGVPWLGGFVHADRIVQDVDTDGADLTLITAGVYADLIPSTLSERTIFGFPRMRLYIGYQRERYGSTAGPLPGVPDAFDRDRLLITLSARANVSLTGDDATN